MAIEKQILITTDVDESVKSIERLDKGFTDSQLRVEELSKSLKDLQSQLKTAFKGGELESTLKQSISNVKSELASAKAESKAFATELSRAASSSAKSFGDLLGKTQQNFAPNLSETTKQFAAIGAEVEKLKLTYSQYNEMLESQSGRAAISENVVALSALKNQFIALGGSAANFNKLLSDIGTPFKDQTNSIAILRKQLAELETDLVSIDTNSDDFSENVMNALSGGAVTAKELTESLKDLNNELIKLEYIDNEGVLESDEDVDKYMTSIKALKMQVKLLTEEFELLNVEERKGDRGKELSKTITKLKSEINEANTSIGKGFNVFSNSVQQVGRELPNFFIDARIGIMALSNNLPILGEQMDEFRKKNQLLRDEGKPTKSLWKEVTNSFTGLSGAFTLVSIAMLALPKIWDWIKELKSAKKVISEFGNTVNVMYETMKSGGGVYGDAVKNLQKVEEAQRQFNKGNLTAEQYLSIYNKTLGNVLGNEKEHAKALKNVNDKKDVYIKAMRDMAIANALFAETSKNVVKMVQLQVTSNSELLGNDKIKKASEEVNKWAKGSQTEYTKIMVESARENLNKLIEEANKEREKRVNKLKETNKALESTAEKFNTSAYGKAKRFGLNLVELEKENKEAREKVLQDLNLNRFNYLKATTESEIEMMEDGYQKELKALEQSITDKREAALKGITDLEQKKKELQTKLANAKTDPEKKQLNEQIGVVDEALKADKAAFANYEIQLATEKFKKLSDLQQKYIKDANRIIADYSMSQLDLSQQQYNEELRLFQKLLDDKLISQQEFNSKQKILAEQKDIRDAIIKANQDDMRAEINAAKYASEIKQKYKREEIVNILGLTVNKAKDSRAQEKEELDNEQIILAARIKNLETLLAKKGLTTEQMLDYELKLKKAKDEAAANDEEKDKLVVQSRKDNIENAKAMFNGLSQIFDSNTEVAKGAKSAEVGITSLQGAFEAYTNYSKMGPWGVAAGIAQAAGIIGQGVQTIKKIWAVNKNTKSVSPNNAIVPPQIQATKNTLTNTEAKLQSENQKVYVVATEVDAMNKKIKVNETEASY